MPRRATLHACMAAVVAGLLASACSKKKTEPTPEPQAETPATPQGAEEIRCEGANSCKGQSACHTAESPCAGQNSCKGKGWVAMAAKDCIAKGGKVGQGPTKM